MADDSASFHTTRVLAHPPARVYAAFADAGQLAIWWGPQGFRNEFEEFHFGRGGRWKFVMIGPDGARHDNLNTFVELQAETRVVIQHESAPRFRLTVDAVARCGRHAAVVDPGVRGPRRCGRGGAHRQAGERAEPGPSKSALLAAAAEHPCRRAKSLAAADPQLRRSAADAAAARAALRLPRRQPGAAARPRASSARPSTSWRPASAAARTTCTMRRRRCSSSWKAAARCGWPARCLPLRAGDVVFIPPGPEYPHQILNTSDAPLKYLSDQHQGRRRRSASTRTPASSWQKAACSRRSPSR